MNELINDIEYAKGIEGFLAEEQGLYLHKTTEDLPPNSVIVEIGSYLGRSTCFIASALRNDGKLFFAVDTFETDAMNIEHRNTFADFTNNTKRFADKISVLKGNSKEIVKTFEKEIDLLFIDGDHSYEGCLADLESWLPLVKAGGLIVFHDYYNMSHAKRVKVVVDQFCMEQKIILLDNVRSMAVTKKLE